MREKIQRFMMGRYGSDDFSRFLTYVCLACIVLSMFLKSSMWNLIIIALLIYQYYRIFSRDYHKRYEENQRFLEKKASFLSWLNKEKYMMDQKKTFHIYSCPTCRQKIRIPKGKGRIIVRCPKCKTEFEKRS